MSEYDIHVGNVGENVGAQAVTKESGKVVGKAYTEFSESESKRAGKTIVRGRIEVDPEHQGQGLGSKLAGAVRERLGEVGGVTHQESFTESGEKLRAGYEKAGYKPRKDVPEVVEKDY